MTTTQAIQTEAVNENTLRVTCVLNASPSRVYDAWTRADLLTRWFAPSDGFRCDESTFDVRVGGEYRLCMVAPDGDRFVAFGRYLTLDAPSKIAFTWKWEESNTEKGESQVSIELTPEQDGTRLVLLHERLSGTESRELHSEGWSGCLTRLVAFINNAQE